MISLVLSYLHRRATTRSFTWSPSLDLSDNHVYAALIPSAHS